LRLHYDPKIGEGFKQAEATDLWPVWRMIRCPVLVARAGRSDVLTEEIALQMKRTGPKAELIFWPDAGHAPLLILDYQIQAVIEWLEA